MTNKQHIVTPVLIGLVIIALVAKKLMMPFASVFMVISLDALAVYHLVSSLVIRKGKQKSETQVQVVFNNLVYCGAALALLINIQHWRGAELWSKAMFIALLAYSFAIVRLIPVYRKMKLTQRRNLILNTFLPFGFFLIMIGLTVILTPRQFHNLFYGNTYEQFVRQKYPDEIAEQFIQFNRPIDVRSLQQAEKFYQKAMWASTTENYDECIRLLNKSIDYNPENAEAYYQRGLISLTKLELSKYSAEDALKDFNRAIRYQPTMAKAYFQRATCRKFLTPRAFSEIDQDIERAAALDTIYKQFVSKR